MRACSLRVAVAVFVLIIVIIFAVVLPFVLFFLFVIVGLFSKEDLGAYRMTRRVRAGAQDVFCSCSNGTRDN